MRLALSTSAPPDRWPSLAGQVEAVGFDVLQLADHLIEGMLPPLTGLLVATEATERIALGTMVLANDFRHPAILAREVAMLANGSGGRFELGLGAGHMKSEYDAAGIGFDPAALRAARLAESVQVLRRLLAGEVVTFEGDHYRLHEHHCWPVPTAPVPILVGGNGDRVLRVAAEHADIVGLTGVALAGDGTDARVTHFTAAGLQDRVNYVRRAAGTRASALRFQVLVQRVVLTADRRAAAEDFTAWVPGATVDDILDSPFLLLGTAAQIAEQLRERSQRFGIDTWTVLGLRPDVDQPLDALAPIVEAVRSSV